MQSYCPTRDSDKYCIWVLLLIGTCAITNAQADAQRGVHRIPISVETNDGSQIPLYSGSHALLVGASKYTNWPRLDSIPDELAAVESALFESGFNVERLSNPDANLLEQGIKNFIDRYGYEPDNRLLIYFSGHGHSVGDEGYLLPIDIPHPDNWLEFRRKALPMTQIMAWAKRIDAKHALFLFDSCFSGTVFKSRNLPTIKERYIRNATTKPVRQFISAGSANEEVPAKSTFTPAFVDAIKGEGDLNNDGYITGSELGVHLSQLVPQFVNQTPQYGKIQDYELSRGDFVFVSPARLTEDRNNNLTIPDQDKIGIIRQRYAELATAISNKDMEIISSLVNDSKSRIAYLEYLFGEFETIQARSTNFEFSELTGNATGRISIDRLFRKNGDEGLVSQSFRTMELQSLFEGSTWSQISW